MDDPEGLYMFGGQLMRQRTIVLEKLYTRDHFGLLKHTLLSLDRPLLWASLYVAFSVVGWCGSVWLKHVTGNRQATPMLSSLLLAGLAGGISFLLVRLLARSGGPDMGSSYGLCFAVLAGLFLTRFYGEASELIPDFFKAVRGLLRRIGCVAAIGLLAVAAGAQDIAVPKGEGETLSYFRCARPEGVKCMAVTPADKAQCPSCTAWETKVVSRQWAGLWTDGEHGQSAKYANHFLALTATEFCGAAWPVTRQGSPVPTKAVYANPERWGWTETAPGGDGACLAVYPGMGGLIVGEATKSGSGVAVLYLSASRGTLAIVDSEVLGQAKFLEPLPKH